MYKVLVFGGSGQLGQSLEKTKTEIIDLVRLSSSDCDITDYEKVKEAIELYSPDVIINCSAYTNVEKAEEEVEGCYAINVDGVLHICDVAKKLLIPVIHISTDYVFNGNTETDYKIDSTPNPKSVYGQTKYLSEKICLEIRKRNIVIRTSWVYSEFGKNFAKTILERVKTGQKEFTVVDDQYGKPTYAPDLAKAIYQLIEEGVTYHSGIYHYAGNELLTWKEFTDLLTQDFADVTVKGIKTKDYPSKVDRPLYSGLEVSREFGVGSDVKQGVKYTIDYLNKEL